MTYWAKTIEEALREFSSSENGLDDKEVDERLAKYGLNDIPVRKKKSAISLLVSQIKDVLIIALTIASAISLFTGGVEEAVAILIIVVINISLGFIQEYKSEKSLQTLIKYITYRTKVLRKGGEKEVDAKYIVPGDIVFLETGDRVPADLRLLETDELEIDESIVTGESYPSHKISPPIAAKDLAPQKMKNMAFMGTLVVNGKGKGIVVSTAMESTFGKVVGFLKTEEPETNYQKNIRKFGSFLIKGITIGIVFIFIVNALTGFLSNSLTAERILDSALFSLALAVGIIPESLPIIITIGLTRGAALMSKKGVIVKKLSSIEDLGNMDVFCSDKTGTLTENKITLIDYVDLDGNQNDDLLQLAAACTSTVQTTKATTGNPLDVALIDYVKQKSMLDTVGERVELIPFDYSRRRMSVIVKRNGKHLLICKGAPESVIQVSSRMKVNGEIRQLDPAKVEELAENLFRKGYRVISVATKDVEKKLDYDKDEENNLTLLGFLCFKDPLKPTAKESISQFRKLGVEVKILTGDNPTVAKTIVEDVGLEAEEILTGENVDSMNDDQLEVAAEKANVFARLTPEHKARIVSLLSKHGHVTGFLGDGVNDAPALRYADIGISVDSGVDIAKEAADIILTQPSLDIISGGIIEGRTTFSNTTKYILNTISANVGNMATLAIISVLLDFLPMLPIQILLTNLISDGPLLSISTDKVDEGELTRPRNWDIKSIGRFARFFGGISSVFDFVTMGLTLILVGSLALTPEEGRALFRTCWFVESTLSEIIVTFAIRTRTRFYKSRPSKILLLSSVVFGLLTILLPYSPLSTVFDFFPPTPFLLSLIFGILLLYFIVVEISKHFFHEKDLGARRTKGLL
jgi:Mg2+-importing ATPase